MNKIAWKKRLIQAVWILAGIGTIVLMGAAMQHKNRKKCTDIKIEISGIEEHMFIDEKDVLDLIQSKGKVTGIAVAALDLRAMEHHWKPSMGSECRKCITISTGITSVD